MTIKESFYSTTHLFTNNEKKFFSREAVNVLTRGAERTFGPRGKKFVWALWSVVPQKHMISKKKGHSVRRCSNFGLKSSDEQKKGHSLRRCSNSGSTSSDEQHTVIASADVRISARNQKITSSRPQAVV